MKASLIDRSNYYRGLLVLIARDRNIDLKERRLMLQIGKMLDFDKRFCEATIADLLDNVHINEKPIRFDEQKIAECFLRDALKLAMADNVLHSQEMAWLKSVAQTNGLTDDWFEAEQQNTRKMEHKDVLPESFEIHRYL